MGIVLSAPLAEGDTTGGGAGQKDQSNQMLASCRDIAITPRCLRKSPRRVIDNILVEDHTITCTDRLIAAQPLAQFL